ncbi:hypothetical protein [Clostridium gasigenes]|uniref:Uncharacterized protein n=1 Tax=Clostridium gasigenes TaxID=94869 RepID=A0A1H0RX41_9CLOT|nr:hypothetical protein [Clostridium gasigenes]MBB6622633.1 hypothetical protein [Clostridium gasigenes]MBB6714231.1 hypothetical protein [Clostridium gasigenes]MBU3088565.1 hypothetical protein [Clostridium gasigenes]MBU3103838.1 hypothetical protein [Clostridium gasigenes]MBU3108210.1 hypothetical protein [Clostridium gasigenes]
MDKVIDKILSIFLIMFVVFLVLNEYYVIQFSGTLKNVLVFLTLILILMTSMKQLVTNKSGLARFINGVILFCTIVGGVFAIVNKSLNIFIYVSLLFAIVFSLISLVYKKG